MLEITGPMGIDVKTDIDLSKKFFREGRGFLNSLIRERGAKPGWVVVMRWKAPYQLEILDICPPRAAAPTSASQPLPDREIMHPLNLILYGPPGTGKTFSTARYAVEICDGAVPEESDREGLMQRYEELRSQGRISFCTFHQSFGYEDFIEGMRPIIEAGQVAYQVEPGVFLRACEAAKIRRKLSPGVTGTPIRDRVVWKMSLGAVNTVEAQTVFRYCLDNGLVLLGWGQAVDFSDCTTREQLLTRFQKEAPQAEKPKSQAKYVDILKNEMQEGDIIVVSNGSRSYKAIAEVTGGYQFVEEAPFHQGRQVRWLSVFENGRSSSELTAKELSLASLYKIDRTSIDFDALDQVISIQEDDPEGAPHVLIIDEINRGNISKVFGELITLLEPDKRESEVNGITLQLPYSKQEFCVPSNLHVLGTMNTADRSIALLDTALRRRFHFQELAPNPEVLKDLLVDGIQLSKLLSVMNERIESLYDRDHTIGHAFLIEATNLAALEDVFRRKILPLLQEYFFENWSNIRRVLNDTGRGDFILRRTLPPVPLDGDESEQIEPQVRYVVNPMPFPITAYKRIYGEE
jgi:5-methylcytosine-specific restriction protein B